MSSPYKVTGGKVITIKNGKEGNVVLQYLLLTRSNYIAWLIKMCVNLQAQGVWNAIEHGDVEERKGRMALAAIYQQSRRTFFSCWKRKTQQRQRGDAENNACGCETCQGSIDAYLEEWVRGYHQRHPFIRRHGGGDLRLQEVPSSCFPKIHANFYLHRVVRQLQEHVSCEGRWSS